MCIRDSSWLTLLILKIFWVNRLKGYNAFQLKNSEKIDSLKSWEYKFKHAEDFLKFHKISSSTFCMPINLNINNSQVMLNDAQRRLLNFIRFCYHSEPYDTIILDFRALTEIDTT